MPSKYGTFSGDFLKAVGEATGFFTWPLEGTNAWVKEQFKRRSKKVIYNTVRNLQKYGWLKIRKKNGKLFLKLTSKGELELLIQKAIIANKPTSWDGQWRIIIFDIPENSKKKRDLLRSLLKRNNFLRLQNSVFISPYPLNRSAILYLKQSGLIGFIRFIKADEIDDDEDLQKKFKLLRNQ